MANLESLEALLAEALQCLDESAGLIRAIPQLNVDQNLRRVGHAIHSVWDIQDEIYTLRPDLKPSFVAEYEQDSKRYEKLSELANRAHALEAAGNLSEARALFNSLCIAAVSGHFRIVGEAGLYRTNRVWPH